MGRKNPISLYQICTLPKTFASFRSKFLMNFVSHSPQISNFIRIIVQNHQNTLIYIIFLGQKFKGENISALLAMTSKYLFLQVHYQFFSRKIIGGRMSRAPQMTSLS